MNTESTATHVERTEKGENTVVTVNALWPDVDIEVIAEIGRKVMNPFRSFDTLNSCSKLLKKITSTEEGKTAFQAKLDKHHIVARYDADGKLLGLELQLDSIMKSTVQTYDRTAIEYSIACFYVGRLQQSIASYNGPEGITNRLLGMVAATMAENPEATLEDHLARIDDILKD